MKKTKLIISILTILTPIFITTQVHATSTGYVDATNGLYLRKGPGTTYDKIKLIDFKTNVEIIESKQTDDFSTGCSSNTWYKIKASNTEGFACSNYIVVNQTQTDNDNSNSTTTNTNNTTEASNEMANMTDEEFENYLESQGFPTSYWDKLKKLHKAHPSWVFKGVKAKYTWQNTLSQETEKGRSLYQVTSTGVKNGLQGYLNTGSDYYNYSTDTFKAYDGSTWFQANNETVAYYMDPRNFLTESGIFMFEDLTYYKNFQTSSVVKKILYTDFYKNLINYYIEAAAKYNVSPVYLAALSRQEVGLNSSKATSGKAGTYNGTNYNGYYNFYNIGASSGANPVYNGLEYARKQGWNTQQKAIVEGAKWIVSGYISRGQYTRYFQKWNVAPNTETGIWHQYMTDVHALVSPSATTASSYNSIGVINEPLVFSIPIYIGMPTETKLPPTGNPNNWLKDLKVNDKTVSNFSGSTTTYNLSTVEYETTSIKISTTTVNSNASASINGTVQLNVGTNKIEIVVTAQNGAKKTYTLNITRKDKPVTEEPSTEPNQDETGNDSNVEMSIDQILTKLSIKNNNSNIYGFALGTKTDTLIQNILKQNNKSVVKIANSSGKEKTNSILSTGDKVIITSNKETKSFQVIIFGDLDGDGNVNAKDLLLMRKYLLKEKTITGVYLEAAKLNKNTSVSAKDLLIMRKHLLGTTKISQV